MIQYGDDYISIQDKQGEIVYWHKDEWIEDPDLTIIIAHAVELYYQKGPQHLRELMNKATTNNYTPLATYGRVMGEDHVGGCCYLARTTWLEQTVKRLFGKKLDEFIRDYTPEQTEWIFEEGVKAGAVKQLTGIDKIMCIDNAGHRDELTNGGLYDYSFCDDDFVFVLNDRKVWGWYKRTAFKEVQ